MKKKSAVSSLPLNEQSPLAVRMRPLTLDEFVGQAHALGKDTLVARSIKTDRLSSLIVYGPPGCGKTSLGQVISAYTQRVFVYINAALSSAGQIKEIMADADEKYAQEQKKTLVFVDEIHRFNKLQQDILLAYLESPHITIIGATLYNPFYYLVSALISRSVVVEFKPLTIEDIVRIIERALRDTQRGLGTYAIQADEDAVRFLAEQSNGDARQALTALEIGIFSSFEGDPRGPAQAPVHFTLALAKESIQKKQVRYDRDESGHYDTISSFIKSVRGSDVDSALYWLAKMIYGGEDPRFIARRLIILAAEDIGNADPFSLVLATNCFNAVEYIGMPEARIVLSETTIYLSLAPKSNASYTAIESALSDIAQQAVEEVPESLKNKTSFQKEKMQDSSEYQNPHYTKESTQHYTSNKRKYYFPKDVGREAKILNKKND